MVGVTNLDDTYEELKDLILKPTLNEIALNLNLKLKASEDDILTEIITHFKNLTCLYKSELDDTTDGKLDRHKLSSCLCGAIITVQPFLLSNNGTVYASLYPNELLAFWCGLMFIKVFLVDDYKHDIVSQKYIFEKYPQLPDTTKDANGYLSCVVYSLADMRMKNTSVLNYDVLGNADRFFHIERFNVEYINNAISELKASEITFRKRTAKTYLSKIKP